MDWEQHVLNLGYFKQLRKKRHDQYVLTDFMFGRTLLLVGVRYGLCKPVGTCDVAVTCWTVPLQVVLQFILSQRFASNVAPLFFVTSVSVCTRPVLMTQSVETQILL